MELKSKCKSLTVVSGRGALHGFEGPHRAGHSIFHAGRSRGFHGVVVGGLWPKSGNAHPKDCLRMGGILAIGRLRILREVRRICAVVNDSIMQDRASGIRGGPTDDR